MVDIVFSLVLFLFPLAYSPGPGNMFFAANGARFGFAATIPANAGYHIATWIVTLVIGLGFGWVAGELPVFLVAIKYLGSAYVLFLAWSLFKAGATKRDAEARQVNFTDGVFLLLLNPKAYLIIALMFSQFTDIGGKTQTALIIIIATVFTVNNLLAFSIWAYAGDRLAAVFRRDAEARRLNIVFGAMLACVAMWMLFK
jgi:threonine/homoserine/homoserine lactone efflux protein